MNSKGYSEFELANQSLVPSMPDIPSDYHISFDFLYTVGTIVLKGTLARLKFGL